MPTVHAGLLLLNALLFAGPAADSQWTTEVVLRAPDGLTGCAIGDLDRDVAGLEIAAVSNEGRCYVATRGAAGWTAIETFQAPGETIQCAVGDADPSREGDELVTVGMAQGPESGEGAGAAYLIAKRGGQWVAERIFESKALLHGVCIVDGAVFVVGYDGLIHRLQRGASGWESEAIGELPGAGKSAVAALGGVAVACTDGSVVLFKPEGGAWVRSTLDQRKSGRSRIGANGESLVVSDDDGTLSLLQSGTRTELFGSSSKLRGAVLADLDPDQPGLEAATAGYSRELTLVLSLDPKAPRNVTPFVDCDRLHHLAAGDLDGDGQVELVTCGYSGLLVLLKRR